MTRKILLDRKSAYSCMAQDPRDNLRHLSLMRYVVKWLRKILVRFAKPVIFIGVKRYS